MTQRGIRRLMALYVACVAVVFIVNLSYLRDIESMHLERAYLMEMLRRVRYLTALLNWLAAPDMIDLSDLRNMAEGTPLDVGMLTMEESSVRSMYADSSLPVSAYEFSVPLQRVVSLRRPMSASRPTYGCPGEEGVIGGSMMMLTLTLTLVLGVAANQLAVSRGQVRAAWRGLVSRLLVVTAFLVPIAAGVALVSVLTTSQHVCAVGRWRDETRRTSILISNTYNLIRQTFHQHIPRGGLALTLGSVNDGFNAAKDYSLHVVDFAAQTITPPVNDMVLTRRLLMPDLGDKHFSTYVQERATIITSSPLAGESAMLAVVHNVTSELPSLSSTTSWLALVLLLVPLVVFAVLGIAFFPYASLGRTDGGATLDSPWAWRAPRLWPTYKMLQATAIVAFAVFVASYTGEQLSRFLNVSSLLTRNLFEIVSSELRLAAVGRTLVDNYGLMLLDRDWSTAFMTYLRGAPASEEASVSRFYQRVFNALEGNAYSWASVAEKAALMNVDSLPLMMNNPQTLGFLTASRDTGDDVIYLESLLVAFDTSVLFGILASNSTLLRMGCIVCQEQIMMYAQRIDSTGNGAIIRNLIKATLKNAELFAEIAEANEQQTTTSRGVSSLYDSSTGRTVVGLEEKALNDVRRTSPSRLALSTVNMSLNMSYMGWSVAALCLMGAALALEYVHVATFFGRSRSPADAAVVRRLRESGAGGSAAAAVLPPTNDRTAPQSVLNVNHRRLWRGVWSGTAVAVCLTLVCAVFTIVITLVAAGDIATVQRAHVYEDQSVGPILRLATAVGGVHASSAAWMRALISRNEADVVAAVRWTYAWARRAETKWVDGKPTTSDDRFNGELSDPREAYRRSDEFVREALRATSNLVSAHLSAKLIHNDLASVYEDFIRVLNEYNDFLPITELNACMLTSAEDLRAAARLMRDVMLSLVHHYDADFLEDLIGEFLRIVARHPTCRVDRQRTRMYVRRLARMRLRAAFFTPRQALSDKLTSLSTLATDEAIQSVEASTSVVSNADYSSFAAAWLPIVMGWVCVPLVHALRKAAQRVHRSIYSS